MNKIKILDSLVKKPLSGKVKNIVLFLHGYGADGADLLNISDYWINSLPDTIFYSPNAPFICDVNPTGFQWFKLSERTTEELEFGLQNIEPYLENLVNNLLKIHKLDISNLAIVGFSQGTILSLYSFTKKEKACAGIIGYSGLFFCNEKTKKQIKINFPILLHHGKNDEVIDFNHSINAGDTLKEIGFKVSSCVRDNLGHSIDINAIEMGKNFLKEIFKS